MKYNITFFILNFSFFFATGQECLNYNKYVEKMAAADSCILAGDYRFAQDNYNAAKVYCLSENENIEKAKENLFQRIDKLRLEAETQKSLAENAAEEAENNLLLFSSYAAIQFGFFAENDLSDDFIIWLDSVGREKELDEILPTLIRNSETIELEKSEDYWLNRLSDMSLKDKGKLLNILGRESGKLRNIAIKYGSKTIEENEWTWNDIKNFQENSNYSFFSKEFTIKKEDDLFLINDTLELHRKIRHVVNNSPSFSSKEQVYWSNLLGVMNNEQKRQLINIVRRESHRLDSIRQEYGITEKESNYQVLKANYPNLDIVMSNIDSLLLVDESQNLKFLFDVGTFIENYNSKNANRIFEKILVYEPNNIAVLKKMRSYSIHKKEYYEAYSISKKLIKLESKNYINWYNYSFHCLFVNQPKEAINAAEKTLELNPEALGVETNLALGYLLNNQFGKAEEIYLKWKGKKFPNDDKFCDEIFFQDILDLEAHGLQHPDFDKVKIMFGK